MSPNMAFRAMAFTKMHRAFRKRLRVRGLLMVMEKSLREGEETSGVHRKL